MKTYAKIETTLTKTNARNIAATEFYLNKRATEVHVTGYQAVAIYGYKGQRQDEQQIRNDLVLLRTFKRAA